MDTILVHKNICIFHLTLFKPYKHVGVIYVCVKLSPEYLIVNISSCKKKK